MRVNLFEEVSLQLQQFQGGQAWEGVRLYKLYEVVVQMETDQAHKAFEQTRVHRLQLVVTQLQDLETEKNSLLIFIEHLNIVKEES